VKPTQCIHYWVIAPANDTNESKYSSGRCLNCGDVRLFDNVCSPDDSSSWDWKNYKATKYRQRNT